MLTARKSRSTSSQCAVPAASCRPFGLGFGKLLRLLLQRATAVSIVCPVRKKIAILRVSDEQQPKQYGQRHAVSEIELFGARIFELAGIGDRTRQAWDHLLIDALAQLDSEPACEPLRGVEQFHDGAFGVEPFRR